MKKLMGLLLVFILLFSLTGCNSKDKDETNSNKDSVSDNSKAENLEKAILGETFQFDNFEVTLDKTYSLVTLNNEDADQNGNTVVKLGVNIKNIYEEAKAFNMFYYTLIGSKGNKLDSVATYFDDSIDFVGDVESGASVKKYFYFLYDGDGTYKIEFDNFLEQKTVEFDVKK